MSSMTLASLEEYVAGLVEDSDAEKRRAALAQSLGTYLSQEVRRRDSVELLAALEAKRIQLEADSESAQVIRLLASVVRGYQAGRDSRRSSSQESGSPTVRLRLLIGLLDGERLPTDLAKVTGSPPTVVARTLTALRKQGLVDYAERSGLADGRVRPYVITDEGVTELRRSGLPVAEAHGVVPHVPRGPGPMSRASTLTESRVPPLVRAARKLRRTDGSNPEIVKALAESLEGDLSDRDRADTLGELLVSCRKDSGDKSLEQASSYLDELMLVAERRDPLVVARAYYEAARLQMLGVATGRTSGPLESLEIADSAAATTTEPAAFERRAWCAYSKALVLLEQGVRPEALAAASVAQELFEAHGHSFGHSNSEVLLGRLLLAERRVSEARERLESAVKIARLHKHDRQLASALLWLGEAEMTTAPTTASETLYRAVSVFRGLEDPVREAVAQCGASVASFLAPSSNADSDVLRARMDEALSILRERRDMWGTALTYRRMGVVAREAGDFAAASSMLKRAVECYATLGNPVGQALSLCSLLVSQTRAEATTEAGRSAAKIVKIFKEAADPRPATTSVEAYAWDWCMSTCVDLSDTLPALGALPRPPIAELSDGPMKAGKLRLNVEVVDVPRLIEPPLDYLQP